MVTEPFVGRGGAGAEHTLVVDDAVIGATLTIPLGARALVTVLHARSAGRFGPGSHFVSQVLQQAGFATFQLDLLTPAEEASLPIAKDRAQDTRLLVTRTLAAIDWLEQQPATCGLALGLFASTAETIAASIAAERTTRVRGIVSDGGYPDYFDDALSALHVPVLLIVGSNERPRAPELASEFFARHLLA